MLQIRCTAKVQKELRIKKSELAEVKQSNTLLGDWYVNLFTVDRRKTLIFVNEKTLLSFILFGVKKGSIKKLPEVFLESLGQLLTIEGFDIGQINKVFSGYETYEFTKTVSKRVIGNMNDLVYLYKSSILYHGGFEYIDIGELILETNRTPQKNLGWSDSIDLVKELLQGNHRNLS
ncbi:MAG: hypothetical protein JAY85_14655 [Candidatus Thiodiazotropha weberae]|uniref:DUF6933 domain-containing protein n=1 Tax=Candidatus Thiodiazotropha endoloripes TaxID=1818881 RepID=A0A1E2UMP6_9GAMM|nr:hypothetical protein [Candidatus Thiodiazotropha endoloripes]MCG7899679.1 hypothetical protein [Candidatus Thiodiazotropha weberae]MCG7904347.1 hypothetical protein [Candidatus Thiodiazotropha weberae]MCG7914171.1 hypothetical protein [Candidatus Thiodiazotropha weberae]ODB84148.1 hypothetical protein A3193_15105 [Candidatus Thiodiazotropha endoloripes]ODB91484.1 hypothetical protein A3195_08795 [Candidatus Thiodiazotropha endoloripes]